jgi:hypothetical protein
MPHIAKLDKVRLHSALLMQFMQFPRIARKYQAIFTTMQEKEGRAVIAGIGYRPGVICII